MAIAQEGNSDSETRRQVAGGDARRTFDAVFVNAPLRDYGERPRVNDFTLPVLGMAYIGTYAARTAGMNVGVIDAEALGLGIGEAAAWVNRLAPRWVGMNLLAPTYEMSARIAEQLSPEIRLMLGGHQAKAMPVEILRDPRFAATSALVIGEGETRVAALLDDHLNRARLPGVMWLDSSTGAPITGTAANSAHHLAPSVDDLPFVDRALLVQDPVATADGRLEANMVGARGCPYDCSFCGAAVSANPDVTIRTRSADNIIDEMEELRASGVTAFRFVDDLFLGASRVIRSMLDGFEARRVGDWAVWDATGRINVLARESDETLDRLVRSGLREVALGIESGSERMLDLIDKRITPQMARDVVGRLTQRGIGVKGYFIVGFPTETKSEIDATVRLVQDLWSSADDQPGWFRASMFEYRPYPGTPDWQRLTASGRYRPEDLLRYTAVDLTSGGVDESMLARDEFNFSVNIQLSEAPIDYVRAALMSITKQQHDRRVGGEW